MDYSLVNAAEDTYRAIKHNDVKALRRISNRCAESMATEGEQGMFSLSAISYVLSKILEKPRYWGDEKLDRLSSFVEKNLWDCCEKLKRGDKRSFYAGCSEITDFLEEFDQRNKRYVRGLFDKAKMKIAARMYAQGFSLSYVVSRTGADTREVLKYIGQTLMFDRFGRTKSVEERLKNARRIFE